MHELGIAGEILGIAVSEAERHGARKVTAVRLKVGVLRGVVPDNLAFLFGQLAAGTPAEGAVLEIEDEPVRICCPRCGTAESMSFVVECPRCQGEGVTLTGGDALSVLSLEIDD